ncbi:MAG: hypothetical protein NTZ90_11000 [Proteobacteria bacterium]|nr:hypothetical protein [Pseudomonadota bacterium]
MAKLYLVRRNLEVFSGPMTLAEMKDAYKRMQFGLQDEVAGHCGPWVTFEQLDRIKKQYPEVARIVHEDMIAGWNISSDSEGKLINEDTKRLAIKSMNGIRLALVFLVIAVLAFVAAIYMANTAKNAVKAKDQLESAVRPQDLQNYLDRNDSAGFDRYVQKHAGELTAQVNQRQAPDEAWLPYLRLYAFSHDGQFSGLDPKYLRGNAAASTPVDCSLRMWRRRWRSSSADWNDMLAGRRLVRAHWARLIAWDPYWIKRREHKGWIGEQNYYVACLGMAEKALTEVGNDLAKSMPIEERDRLGYARLKARLAWLQAAMGTATAAVPSEEAKVLAADNSSVGLWTCFEAARDFEALSRCRRSMTGGSNLGAASPLLAYSEERYGWNMLRLASATRGNLPADLVGQLLQQGEKMNPEDHFTRFDYRPEARLFVSLARAGLPTEKAIEKAQSEFPTVRLSH